MTDHVELSAVPADVDQVAVSEKVSLLGCSDYDSCNNGVRRSSGYTWFSAFAVNVGPSPTDPTYYGMHGGLAFGGSGQKSQMYLDWSGYCPSSLGGAALHDGGSPCGTPNTLPTFKPHTVVGLDPSHSYRLTVRSVPSSVSDVTDVSGPLTGWQLALVDEVTSLQQSGGTWCLPNAAVVAHASMFNEVIENQGPCQTDFGSDEIANPQYNTAAGWSAFTNAWGHYNGNETTADADCTNANIRLVGPNDIIDERMTPKGSGGGLAGTGSCTEVLGAEVPRA